MSPFASKLDKSAPRALVEPELVPFNGLVPIRNATQPTLFMRCLLFATIALFATLACSSPDTQNEMTPTSKPTASFFDMDSNTLAGKDQPLAAFKGQPVMVVNTASKCGLTPQYKDLQKLHETYADQGLVVLGFPCNQFMGQEPGSAAEIAEFCEANYCVTFQMMEKTNVKDADQSPIYAWLEAQTGSVPDWNFAKYLVSADGSSGQFFGARTEPMGSELTTAIEAQLAK